MQDSLAHCWKVHFDSLVSYAKWKVIVSANQGLWPVSAARWANDIEKHWCWKGSSTLTGTTVREDSGERHLEIRAYGDEPGMLCGGILTSEEKGTVIPVPSGDQALGKGL